MKLFKCFGCFPFGRRRYTAEPDDDSGHWNMQVVERPDPFFDPTKVTAYKWDETRHMWRSYPGGTLKEEDL